MEKYVALRTSFTASSSTTSHAGIMRLLMNSQKSCPVGLRFHRTFFSKDLHQPSVNIGADGGVDGPSLDPPPEAEAPSTEAEAMQVEGSAPPANPEPDWRFPYLDHLTRGDLPSDKIEA
jgi:hypothetical protein